MRRERLGEGPVADQEPGFNVPDRRLRSEVGRREEELLVVVDDGLGVEDCPEAIIWVDGTWVGVDVWGGYQAGCS